MEAKKNRRILGIPNRYYVLVLLILGIFFAQAYPPISPHIQLPAEAYSETPLFTLPVIGPFYWTNTLTAMLWVDLILILLALAVNRAVRSGSMVPKGISGALEALLEALYNLTETSAGRYARKIFPFFATITLLVLVANWIELIPGVDSIGIIHESEHGYPKQVLVPGLVSTIVKPHDEPGTEGATQAEGAAPAEATEGDTAETAEEAGHGGYAIIPWVRVLSTDLNFTVALALISVFMTQVIGVQALGASYFTKFFNVKTFFSRPIFGVIDFAVGILEIIGEFARILSFAFRLFGNIFAGSVLLFVIGSLVPVFAQSVFLMLEFFVGLIQAVVFGMLTMVFMSLATQGHGEHHDEHEEDMPISGPEMI